MVNFVSLHNHTAQGSNIRFLDSINRPEEMVDRAIALGYKGMAFTDHECLSAAINIIKKRDALQKNHLDFKIIFGNEIYLINETEIKNTKNYFHFILLAKDIEGWQQLKELSSRAWSRAYMERGVERVPTTYKDIEEVIKPNQGHIIASSACIGGEVGQMILAKDNTRLNHFINWCLDVFGHNNFYLEMQPADYENQIIVNKVIKKMSQFFKIPYIVTTDSHYLDKQDFALHSAFLNSRQTNDRETDKFYRFTYVMPQDEIRELLKKSDMTDEEIDIAFQNTCDIGNRIEDYDFRHTTIIPAPEPQPFVIQHLFKDWYEKYPFLKQFAYSQSIQDRYLLAQIETGIVKKDMPLTDEKVNRLNTELDIISFISDKLQQSLSGYLNLTVDMVNTAWAVSLVCCGRGSACGEYINYLIGATQVNPLIYGLPYWRFANKERIDLFDIDEDYQPEKTEEIIALLRQKYGEDNVLNCATFKTESLKSAVLTSCRGLQINNDEAQAIAAMVPQHRGKVYTLKQCEEGDEEQGFKPVPAFIERLHAYNGLYDMVKKIEGLFTGVSIHASALYVFNNGYLAQNSLMRAPNGTKITAFNMHDSDDMGALKMDVLRTDAQSKMAKCLNLLLADNQIQWQGSLRATYDKYLHPDVLVYDDPKMWEKAWNGQIEQLFQFETQVGGVCIKKARPTNVLELAEINSIMRLQSDEGEQPIDRYVRFRNNIQEWYQEMQDAGLNIEEVRVLEKYLKKTHGVSGSQETLMLLIMDPQISNYTLGEANAFRKAIAKKITAQIIANKKKFFDKCEKQSTSDNMAQYVWDKCIQPQTGYSFCLSHTLPYSIIGVQEMNLATRWNPLYWSCACLCINTGSINIDFDNYDDDNDLNDVNTQNDIAESTTEDPSEVKTNKSITPNYVKISKAITDAQLRGVHIELPDINKAEADFIPDIENNAILYSLRTVAVVSDTLFQSIIEKRPFTSFQDFLNRVSPTVTEVVGLIKAGCFDRLTGISRRVLLLQYLTTTAEELHPAREKLTVTQIKKIITDHNCRSKIERFQKEIRLFNFTQYIKTYQNSPDDKTKFLLNDIDTLRFFKEFNLESQLKIGSITHLREGILMNKTAFKKWCDNELQPLTTFLNGPEGLKFYHDWEVEQELTKLKEKYNYQDPITAWEMEQVSFYHAGHELQNIDNNFYKIRDFNSLPEEPIYEEFEKNGQKIKSIKNVCGIAGTVVGSNNTKNIVSLLTPYGVVDIKLYRELYNRFKAKISVLDVTGKKKTTIDDSWFKRGTKLLVYGYRRENMFVGKQVKINGQTSCILLIEDVYSNKRLQLRSYRKKAD